MIGSMPMISLGITSKSNNMILNSKKNATEIAEKNDSHNLTPDQNTEKLKKNYDLIPLVLNWHQYFLAFRK